MPYFGYARQDRKSEGRVPITAKLVANMITAARADRVITIDLHAAQIQGFFDLPLDHLSATPVFLDYFESIRDELGELCLVSPDVGNVKVAEGLAKELQGDLAIINKQRLSGSEVKTGNLIGDVAGKTVLMFDDMISTGGTVCEAAQLVMDEGAKDVIVAATHPVLAGLGGRAARGRADLEGDRHRHDPAGGRQEAGAGRQARRAQRGPAAGRRDPADPRGPVGERDLQTGRDEALTARARSAGQRGDRRGPHDEPTRSTQTESDRKEPNHERRNPRAAGEEA
jgi:hypothetical protein